MSLTTMFNAIHVKKLVEITKTGESVLMLSILKEVFQKKKKKISKRGKFSS